MTNHDHSARFVRAQGLLAGAGLDALLLASGPNLFYLAGFGGGRSGSRPYILVLPRVGKPCLIVHQGRQYEARALAAVEDVRTYARLSQAPVEAICRVLDELGARRVGMELGREHTVDLQAADLKRLWQARPGLEWADAGDLLWNLRGNKSALEIDAIRRACQITGRAYDRVYAEVRAGMSEREIEARMLEEMIALGGRAPWVLITSGAGRYDLVSKTGDSRRVETGDMVWMDAGCTCEGYHSDFSRAGVVGGATDVQRRTQERVHAVTIKTVRAIRPGARVADLAARCTAALEGLDLPAAPAVTSSISGLAGRIGHGLGLATTEWPSINEESEVVLEAGMVITVEPGLATTYGTFHIEENVAVTETGVELLSTCDWRLRDLGI
jgi:Xaa-Pro aminopeptidase